MHASKTPSEYPFYILLLPVKGTKDFPTTISVSGFPDGAFAETIRLNPEFEVDWIGIETFSVHQARKQ